MLMNCVSSYYITLAASDPASGSVLTFQVKVDEHMLGRLTLIVSVARRKGDLWCIVLFFYFFGYTQFENKSHWLN